ncbi:hypothetical protein EDB19DRAFT_1708855 [Suillus lakei]|nr:hypothetical protein EDB19DRAFT_1708855 [Suillus lakei]
MQASTTSPSVATHSTDFDSAASQHNTILETAANTHTQNCGRHGCPVVFKYNVGAGWPTVSRMMREHTAVCKGGSYELDPSYVLYHTHSAQHASSPLQPTPESLGLNNSNRDEVIALSSKQRQKEDERRAGLEGDVYTADVQPTSVRCRGCQKVIKLDRRSRYYSGLWTKHRGKCPGILKIESDKLMSGGDCYSPSNPERHPPAASSFGASGGSSNGDGVVPSSSESSDVRFNDNRWAWRAR